VATGKVAKGGVGAGGGDHRGARLGHGAQRQGDQAVGTGVHQQVLQRNVLLAAEALAYAQRLGIAIAVNVFGHGVAKAFAQRTVGHVQPFVGTQPVGNGVAELAFQHLDAGKRIVWAVAVKAMGIAGHGGSLVGEC
jgi:hypothetical protein